MSFSNNKSNNKRLSNGGRNVISPELKVPCFESNISNGNEKAIKLLTPDKLQMDSLLDYKSLSQKKPPKSHIQEAIEKPYPSTCLLNPFEPKVAGLSDYYVRYHELRTKNDKKDEPNSARTNYIKACDNFGIIPEPLAIIPHPNDLTTINLKSYSIGDNYATAHSLALNANKSAVKLDISNNRLTSKGILPILEELPNNIKEVDLSENTLSKSVVDKLTSIIVAPFHGLTKLYLRNTHLADNWVISLMNILKDHELLQYLDLSYNEISNRAAEVIGECLTQNQGIKGLSLAWNQLRGSGAVAVVQGIVNNTQLEVVDLSWNGLSPVNKSIESAVPKLCELFEKNPTILHLDLSHNHFSKEDIEKMNEALSTNHTLLGLHMEGENCITDAQGYIQAREETVVNPLKNAYYSSNTRTKPLWDCSPKDCYRDNADCWICGGWRQYTIKYTPNKSGPDADDVRICFSFDAYVPMSMDKEDGAFVMTRMFPPGRSNFVFLLVSNHEYKPVIHAQDLDRDILGSDYTIPGVEGMSFNVANFLDNEVRCETLLEYPLPRSREAAKAPLPPPPPKDPWKFQQSIFFSYNRDNDEFLKKCFEADWSHTKCAKFIKNVEDLEKTKLLLKCNYKKLKDIYKYYTVWGEGDPFSMRWNSFTEFCMNCSIPDDITCALKDLDTIFIATNVFVGAPRPKRNNERAFMRYEFLEAVTRIAIAKYIKSQTVSTVNEAVKLLLEKNLSKAKTFDVDAWRWKRLYNEKCDLVYKENRTQIQAIFDKYSGREALPGEKPFMSLSEYTELLTQAGLLDEGLVSRDLQYSFVRAEATPLDETTTWEDTKMHFLEFIDALGQIAEYKKYPDLPQETTHLSVKLERVIQALLPLLDRRRSSVTSSSTQRQSAIGENSLDSARRGSITGAAPNRRSMVSLAPINTVSNSPRRRSIALIDSGRRSSVKRNSFVNPNAKQRSFVGKNSMSGIRETSPPDNQK